MANRFGVETAGSILRLGVLQQWEQSRDSKGRSKDLWIQLNRALVKEARDWVAENFEDGRAGSLSDDELVKLYLEG